VRDESPVDDNCGGYDAAVGALGSDTATVSSIAFGTAFGSETNCCCAVWDMTLCTTVLPALHVVLPAAANRHFLALPVATRPIDDIRTWKVLLYNTTRTVIGANSRNFHVNLGLGVTF
jgi:hypothetical protein